MLNNLPISSLLFIGISIILLIILVIQQITFSVKIKKARTDAVKRSKAVIGGQLAEQMAAYFPDFPCNPCDARFIGKPVDFIAFPGLEEKGEAEEVLLVEVKTGESKLSEREKSIKQAVKDKRVRYVEYKI